MLDGLKQNLDPTEIQELEHYINIVTNCDNKEILAGLMYSVSTLLKAIQVLNEKHNELQKDVIGIGTLLSTIVMQG
jgi:hypothetical protein